MKNIEIMKITQAWVLRTNINDEPWLSMCQALEWRVLTLHRSRLYTRFSHPALNNTTSPSRFKLSFHDIVTSRGTKHELH